jgi:hypothetical protein
MYGYLKAVLVDGEVPEIDADTAATLAGFVLGQRVAVLVSVQGMTMQDATAAGLGWVAEQAALTGSMAAVQEEGS